MNRWKQILLGLLRGRQGRTIMEVRFDRIIVTADVWGKRKMRAGGTADHI